MNVSLLIVATNKYIRFLPELISSVRENFLTDHEVTINIFTNRIIDCNLLLSQSGPGIRYYEIDHKPWPYTTLYRYHFFRKHKKEIPVSDFYYYIDADTLIKGKITGEEIFGDRVGTQHCGFVNGRGSYETRKESTSYVGPDEGTIYFGGGFWGFNFMEFWTFIHTATLMIDTDEKNGIIPVWHDESVLNKYFIENPPLKMLTPSFHYPESKIEYYKKKWDQDYECKILLLDKKHDEIRL